MTRRARHYLGDCRLYIDRARQLRTGGRTARHLPGLSLRGEIAWHLELARLWRRAAMEAK